MCVFFSRGREGAFFLRGDGQNQSYVICDLCGLFFCFFLNCFAFFVKLQSSYPRKKNGCFFLKGKEQQILQAASLRILTPQKWRHRDKTELELM